VDLKEMGDGPTGFMWLKIWTICGFCENGNEPSSSIKGGELFTK
jgi:hypothetical protein